MASRSTGLLFSIALSVAGPGCDRSPPLSGTALAGYSKAGQSLWRLSLASQKPLRTFPLPACAGDLARGPGGEIYLASGREILLLAAGGDPVPLLRVNERIDSVLPSRDGARLYILEHPPRGGGPPPIALAGKPEAAPADAEGPEGREARSERQAPHRLRIWDLRGSRFAGEVELDPLAYEICEGPSLVIATHLKGRRIEIAPLGPEGFAAKGAEELEVSDPAAGPLNKQALLRAAAIEPGGGWALIVENGVGGEVDRARLWTLDLAGRRLSFHPLSTRGIFQDGISFLAGGSGGLPRALLNGRDRLLLVTGGPAEGFREGKVLQLPGLFFDSRIVFSATRGEGEPGGSARSELVLLAGSDQKRERGFIAAVDPIAPQVVWVRDLPGPADLLELEN